MATSERLNVHIGLVQPEQLVFPRFGIDNIHDSSMLYGVTEKTIIMYTTFKNKNLLLS